MEKIILTEKEIEVIEKSIDDYKNGLSIHYCGEMSKILNDVIDKALNLQRELGETDSDEDIIVWYYNKYKSQAA